MTDRIPSLVEGGGDVLLLSMRRVHDLVAFCAPYEFEDVVARVTGADRVEIVDFGGLERARRVFKMARRAQFPRAIADKLARPRGVVRLARDYELFLPVFNHPFELYALAAVPDWRSRCRRAVCLVSEAWVHDLPGYLLEVLSEFDHVFLATQNAVGEIGRRTGRPCTYLPLAADVITFAPRSLRDPRCIDVCNIGRRSPVTHAALVARARASGTFYYFDTVAASGVDGKQRTFRVANAAEHRVLLGSILRNSRYFVANRSRINEPDFIGNMDEISGRFYEGAAAGAVLVGEAPRSAEFHQQFNWQDAVVHLPFDSPEASERLAVLDEDPDRVARIRRENVRNAAARHDWLYRLETVFGSVGLAPTAAMAERRDHLGRIAAVAAAGD